MPTMDIVFCLNRRHFVGAVAAVNSIIRNAEHPQSISFHFTIPGSEAPELLTLIEKCFPDPIFRYEIREFQPGSFLEDYIRAGKDLTYSSHGSQVMNFSRFYLPALYPELDKIAYLDADLIVRGDIAELFAIATLEEAVIAAASFATFKSWQGGFKLDSPILRHVDFDDPVFNIGVYVTRLEEWRRRDLSAKLEQWMRTHMASFQEFVFGTQSIMNLALYREVQRLPAAWNLVPLGLDPNVPEATLEAAKILHWAGDRKPWTANGLYQPYWEEYALASGVDREGSR